MIKILSFIVCFIYVSGCSQLSHKPYFGSRSLASNSNVTRSAYDIWSEMQQSGLDFVARPIIVEGVDNVPNTNAGVTFGAEKEASSSLLTRVMSPSDEQFKELVMDLKPAKRKAFLKDFLQGWAKSHNGYRTFKNAEGHFVDLANDVVDINGDAKRIDLTIFDGFDFESATPRKLEKLFDKWLDMTEGRPFTFIKPTTRRKLFVGNFTSLSHDYTRQYIGEGSYGKWKAHFGAPEKYIGSTHGHGGGQHGGWEINFKPMDTYGEFEGLISWFKTSLSTNDAKGAVKLFEAPGHQRMIFSKHPNLNENKLAEVFKMIQALIVVDGIKGGTGIEKANYKDVHSDDVINEIVDDIDSKSYRGAIRLEGSRSFDNTKDWSHTYSIEFRAGTKDPKVQQFTEMVLASRVGANDFSGIKNSTSWTLVEDIEFGYYADEDDIKKFARRYAVPKAEVEKAFNVLGECGIEPNYIVPLWYWTNPKNPFIGTAKRKLLRDMTKDFILQVAKIDPDDEDAAQALVSKKMKYWLRGANLSEDIRHYLMPRKSARDVKGLAKFPVKEGALVDVNKVDVGIEYSGKFPIKTMAFTKPQNYNPDFRLPNGRQPWVATMVDLSDEERKNVIKKVAKSLRDNLGGGSDITFDGADGHGHGLDVAYEFRDTLDRKWRVEWDGISRTYLKNGELVEGSARGGSIELVTPKFVPKAKEMVAVFKAFEEHNVNPFLKAGGGHINIDLAAFAGRPKAMARFLSLFLENRGIISLMYQNNLRLKAGEAINISPELASSLKNFNGSEKELKTLLYNERYFNTRLGRKTRYTQLDLSAYFQDVIPKEFITEDYDILNSNEPWRKQFRVDPKIRKAEFRLFDAPMDAADSSLQLKLVRALMNEALNEDSPLSGTVQAVNHENYLKNLDKANVDFEKFCAQVGLDPDEYRGALARGLAETKLSVSSRFYKSISERLAPFKHVHNWGEAVAPRPASRSIKSEGRHWSSSDARQISLDNQGQHIPEAVQSAELNEGIRAEGLREGMPASRFYRESCVTNATRFLR